MARVPLEELMPNPVSVGGDNSWKFKKMHLPDYLKEPLAFLAGYVEGLIKYSCDFEGKRAGNVVFLCGRSCVDMFSLLDSEIEAHREEEDYVVYGVLVTSGYRVSFYKWELKPCGAVVKESCNTVYNFTRPDEVCDIIGPTIRGMLNEVTGHKHLKFLEAGKHVKLHEAEDILDPVWQSALYPPKPRHHL